MESPLSESSVSLKLSLIRKRCAELLDDDSTELRLADTDDGDVAAVGGAYNPYNHI